MLRHRRHLRGTRLHLWSLVALLVVVALIVGIVSYIYKEDISKSAFAGNYTASEVIDSVNQERVEQGLQPLKTNLKLMEAARNKVEDMHKNNYFAHISPIDGRKWSSFIREAGYDYTEAGENLANGFDNVPDLVSAWMNSPTHRDNILNPDVDETGVSVKTGYLDGYPTIFVAQTFGKRAIADSTEPKLSIAPASQTPTNTAPTQETVSGNQKNTNDNTNGSGEAKAPVNKPIKEKEDKKEPEQKKETKIEKETKIKKGLKLSDLGLTVVQPSLFTE